jgi:hypothetical protein
MAESVTEYAKEVFKNLDLHRYEDLAIMSAELKTDNGIIPCDVIVAVRELPEGDVGEAKFLPLAMIIDSRNRDAFVEPENAVIASQDTQEPQAASDPAQAGVDHSPTDQGESGPHSGL